jgi:hypothetical protein
VLRIRGEFPTLATQESSRHCADRRDLFLGHVHRVLQNFSAFFQVRSSLAVEEENLVQWRWLAGAGWPLLCCRTPLSLRPGPEALM